MPSQSNKAIAPPTINGYVPLHQMEKRVLDPPRQATAPPNKNGYIPGHDGTFAQNYQDTWFEAVARHNGWLSRPGFFLDLGAFKPYECSNSALLELKYGWNGICVEPREFSYGARTAIVANRAMSGDSGQAINMNVVAGDDDGQMFQMAATQHRTFKPVKTINVPDLISCVNASTAPSDSKCIGVHGSVHVPQVIEFVNLDVEDKEADVLRTWPWDKVTVYVFVIENQGAGGKFEKVRQYMRQHGYIKAPVQNPGVDEYFILPRFWNAALAKKAWRDHPEGSNGC